MSYRAGAITTAGALATDTYDVDKLTAAAAVGAADGGGTTPRASMAAIPSSGLGFDIASVKSASDGDICRGRGAPLGVGGASSTLA